MKAKMKQIKPKMKQILMVIAVIFIVLLTYMALVMRVINTEEGALADYARSIAGLSEVEEVIDLHRFHGTESYVVAQVVLRDGQEFYYFVREETVKYYVASEDLVEEEQVLATMWSTISDEGISQMEAELIGIQLGILNEDVVFEVRVRLDEQVHYVVVDGRTGDVLLHFTH